MKINVMFIIEHLFGGGAERVVAELTRELSLSYNITLVTFEEKGTTYKYGGEFICLNLPGSDKWYKKIITFILRWKAITKIKKTKKINVSISFMSNANLINTLTIGKDKRITSVRTLLSTTIKSKFRKIIEKIILRKSDVIVSLSEAVKQDLINNFYIKPYLVKTIYNPCDVENIQSLYGIENHKYEKLFNKANKYIVTMGRLETPKGHWHLLRSFKEVNKIIPETRLIIIGSGSKREKLIQLTINLGLEDYVTFIEFNDNPFRIIRNCDVFAFTSIWEGLGNAIIEALACEKVVVSSDCVAGPREILSPNTINDSQNAFIEYGEYGILVSPFKYSNDFDVGELYTNVEEKTFAKALINILKDTKTKESYENRAKLRASDFSSQVISSQWMELIKELLYGNFKH